MTQSGQPTPAVKSCPACSAAFSPRPGEAPSTFTKRRFCSLACAYEGRNDRPTQANRYPSHYSETPKWVSANQFLAEVMCERIARKMGADLPVCFWNTKPWKGVFMRQIRAASALLKEIEADKVVAAVTRTPEGRRVFSLAAPHLPELARNTELAVGIVQPAEPTTGGPARRPFARGAGLLARLEQAEGSPGAA